MNDYEVDTFAVYRDPQTKTRCLRAHSAADALTCVELELKRCGEYGECIDEIRCVEPARWYTEVAK